MSGWMGGSTSAASCQLCINYVSCAWLLKLSVAVTAGSAADELQRDEEKRKKRRKVPSVVFCHARGTLLHRCQDWLC